MGNVPRRCSDRSGAMEITSHPWFLIMAHIGHKLIFRSSGTQGLISNPPLRPSGVDHIVRLCFSISSKQIPCINLLFYVIQHRIIPIRNDGIRPRLELLYIINNETTKERGSVYQRRLIDDKLVHNSSSKYSSQSFCSSLGHCSKYFLIAASSELIPSPFISSLEDTWS